MSRIRKHHYSPQLNGIERLWAWLKRNFLAHRVLDSLAEIVDVVSAGYLTITPDRFRSICTCSWMETH